MWRPADSPECVCGDLLTPLSVCVEQESGLKVNQPASFAVSLNGAKGVIDAKVHSPSGALEECCITEIDQGNHGDGLSHPLRPS